MTVKYRARVATFLSIDSSASLQSIYMEEKNTHVYIYIFTEEDKREEKMYLMTFLICHRRTRKIINSIRLNESMEPVKAPVKYL